MCPAGTVAWGRYPQLTCVRSLARTIRIAIAPLAAKNHSSASSPDEKAKISAVLAKLGLMRTTDQQARDLKTVQKVSPLFLAKLRKEGVDAKAANGDERRALAVYARGQAKAEVGSDYLSPAEKQLLAGSIKTDTKAVAPTTPPLPPTRVVKQSGVDAVAATTTKKPAASTGNDKAKSQTGNAKNNDKKQKTKNANNAGSRKPSATPKCKSGKRLVNNKCV